MTSRIGIQLALLLGCATLAAPGIAAAQAAEVAIAAQPLEASLRSLAQQTGANIVFTPETVRGVQAPAISGRFSSDAAVARLLRDTGLEFRVNSDGTIVIKPAKRSGTIGVSTSPGAPGFRFAQAAVASGRASAPAGPAQAARPSNAQPTGGGLADEIVVTASKRAQRLVDVPMSIGAMSQEELEREGIRSLLDLSRSVPGLVVVESGPGQNRIFMRGVANGNSSTSLVGVYLDEMPVTGSAFGQLDLQLVDLERVEVLRGPQGTLYGQGSAGGTIRFITRDPELDTYSGRFDVEASDVAHGDASVRVTGVANLPVVTDTLGIRVSGTFAELGGWIDQPDADREDINNQKLRDVRVKGLWTPANGLRIGAFVVVHRNRGDGIAVGADADQNVFFPNGDPLAQERLVDDFTLYNATMSYDFGPATLLSSTSYTRSRKQADGYAVKLPLLDPGYESFNEDAQRNKIFTQELRVSSSGGGPFNWVGGLYYTDESFDRLLVINQYYFNESIGAVSLPTLDTSEAWSVFGDASYKLTDRLEAGAGVRYFHDKRGQVTVGLDLTNSFSSVDPRLYATFALTPEVKLYANVAKGFRSGGFSGDTTARTFDPENIWSYEAGVKGKLQNHLRFELTGFYSNYENLQTFAITEGILGGLVNSGAARIKGVDGLLAFDATEGLSFELTGNITDAKLVEVLPTSFTNMVGDRVDFIPKYSFSASAEYRFDLGSQPGFARVDYNQIGKSAYTDHSANVVGFESDTLQFLNARLGIEHGAWAAELFAQNILDENGIQDPLASFGLGSRPRPRIIGVKFGAGF